MSREALENDPELRGIPARYREVYGREVDQYVAAIEAHKQAVLKAKAEGTDLPPSPVHPSHKIKPHFLGLSTDPFHPSAYYNGMLAPLVPYAIRGVIWYQGESNVARAHQYRTLFPALIKSWREEWGQGDFPFLFVQLAPYTKIVGQPGESDWAELREAQLLTALKVPRTAMAVITDAGDENDIHPKAKDVVGRRLALAARAVAYGEDGEYSGPVLDRSKVEGDKIVLTFKHAGKGLVARGGPLAASPSRAWTGSSSPRRPRSRATG